MESKIKKSWRLRVEYSQGGWGLGLEFKGRAEDQEQLVKYLNQLGTELLKLLEIHLEYLKYTKSLVLLKLITALYLLKKFKVFISTTLTASTTWIT